MQTVTRENWCDYTSIRQNRLKTKAVTGDNERPPIIVKDCTQNLTIETQNTCSKICQNWREKDKIQK